MVTCSQCGQELPEASQPIEEREWGSFEKNIYSNPENCGLALLGTAQEEPNYDFHIVVFLRDGESGRYFMAFDSGCSCPMPFEDHRSVSHLTEVQDVGQAIAFLNAQETGRGWDDEGVSIRKAFREFLPRW